LEQTYANIEIIIIDISPTYAKNKLLKYLREKDQRIKIIHLPKLTPFQKAVDRGIEQSHGQYLLFSEQSHIHKSTRIALQLQYLRKRKDHIAAFCKSNLLEYFPFSLMIARQRIPFRFNPYDPRCLRELSSYGKVGTISTNLLTIQNSSEKRFLTNINLILAASFSSHAKAYIRKKSLSFETAKKLLEDFMAGIRLARR